MPDKPPGMFKNGRPKVKEFKPEERLYRRVSPDDWGDPHPDIDAIELPDMSVNRGKPYGEPEWVLLELDEHENWGIVYFEVQSIPGSLSHEDGKTYTFRAEHVPLEGNYPHAEVWAFLHGEKLQSKKLFNNELLGLSLRWRNALLQRVRNYRWPATEETD